MRLKIKLQSHKTRRLTIDYHYPLSASIYKMLRFGSPEFAEFLHNQGYRIFGRTYKLFNFALQFDHIGFNKDHIRLISPNASLYISSPLGDEFIQSLVTGILQKPELDITGNHIYSSFIIQNIETLPCPEYKPEMNFRLLSPVVLSTKQEYEGKITQHYLRYNDSPELINRVLQQNLANKFRLINHDDFTGAPVTLTWDADYINRKIKAHKRITKKKSIVKGTERPVEIIGNEAPFRLNGDPGLIRIGYECGFGEKNSMGFGMAEAQ